MHQSKRDALVDNKIKLSGRGESIVIPFLDRGTPYKCYNGSSPYYLKLLIAKSGKLKRAGIRPILLAAKMLVLRCFIVNCSLLK
jgi:hypothetical protein